MAARLARPGFGLPLEDLPPWDKETPTKDWKRFPHAIADFFASEGVTLREQRMLDFINQITDKPQWWEKIHDEEIISKWRLEACSDDKQLQRTSPNHLSHRCFDYCVSELRDKAGYLNRHGAVHILDTMATVVKRDVDTSDAFWRDLKQAAWRLEDVPGRRKDWHPGSNGLVLDLLHPSLFPLYYGRTRILPSESVPLKGCIRYAGLGELCAVPEVVSQAQQYRRQVSWGNDTSLLPWGSFQWLPSEISFDANGRASIASYINNLRPEGNEELYKTLTQAVNDAVPLWQECLSWWFDRTRLVPEECGYSSYIVPNYPGYVREHDGSDSDDNEDDDHDDNDDNDDNDDHEYERVEHYQEWIEDHPEERLLLQPDPAEYKLFDERAAGANATALDFREHFSNGIQVIFKLANIHLTPEKPTYHGSNWHIEGALNEHICATALFYYDSDNVADNFLEFRHHMDAEAMVMKPLQNEFVAAEDYYGIKNEEAAVQGIGHVLTRPGRWIAFPNVMQHKVSSFSLADKTKPGHRKILAMFLVDPHIKILSTANVPPQRLDWWAEEVRKVAPFSNLPVELFDRIIGDVDDFPINWETACQMREELMAERGRVNDSIDAMLEQDTFFFCEH